MHDNHLKRLIPRHSKRQMRVNENTVVCGDRVILVPYRPEHVPRYHEWMQSEELLALTASEPLSMDEELEMQCKWHLDEDKLTFILLARPDHLPPSTHPLLSPDEIKGCRMVGDVNMFSPDGSTGEAECEIMIAEKEDRRKGFAREALVLLYAIPVEEKDPVLIPSLSYAIKTIAISPHNLIAKIGSSNTPSIRLFETLGFKVVKLVKVWDEVELRWQPDVPEAKWVSAIPNGRTGPYDFQ